MTSSSSLLAQQITRNSPSQVAGIGLSDNKWNGTQTANKLSATTIRDTTGEDFANLLEVLMQIKIPDSITEDFSLFS